MHLLPLALVLLSSTPAPPTAVALDPEISTLLATIDPARVQQTLQKLVGFSTRNACSPDKPTTGINAARDWLQAQYQALPGVQVRLQPFTQSGCPGSPTRYNVIAWIPGAHPNRLIVISGHYDSRTTNVSDGTSPAPGANDSGSQTALVLEAARALAGHTYDATLVFADFAGEEQGLVGSTAFVRNYRTLFPQATLELDLNSDIVGGDNTVNSATDLTQFRLYSPGTPRETSASTPDGTADDTSPARGVMRYIGRWGGAYVPAMTMVPKLREDRPGRGSDHQPFLNNAIPAVRFIELNETVAHQHAPADQLTYVTPAYTAQVARVVAATAASLARAPTPPRTLTQKARAPASRVMLTWTAPASGPAVHHYVIAARATTQALYGTARFVVPATATSATVRVVEDLGIPAGTSFYVSVAAVDAAGHESLFAYPELRCAGATCAAPQDASDVTARK